MSEKKERVEKMTETEDPHQGFKKTWNEKSGKIIM